MAPPVAAQAAGAFQRRCMPPLTPSSPPHPALSSFSPLFTPRLDHLLASSASPPATAPLSSSPPSTSPSAPAPAPVNLPLLSASPPPPSSPAPSTLPTAPLPLGPGHFEYLPLKAPFRMAMGVQPMAMDDWIQIDPFYRQEMALRKGILANHRSTSPPSTSPASPMAWPSLSLAQQHLHNHASLSHTIICTTMARAIHLTFSGAVLFPNGWILPEKLGLPTAHIHTPVPLYESTISRAVDKFLNNLEPGSPFARTNWTITDDPRLFRPISEASYASMVQAKAGLSEQRLQKEQQQQQQQQQQEGEQEEKGGDAITVESAGWRLFTRSERETFVRLPKTGAVLFTIRTHMKPLRVFSGWRQLAADVVRAMDALPGEIRRYKMIGGRLADVAREYLIRCSEGLA
ncbi:unnamed protein product [Closterium sp. NIES-65]|nr:unnamed protein product [Closterium sp. NIES-65]